MSIYVLLVIVINSAAVQSASKSNQKSGAKHSHKCSIFNYKLFFCIADSGCDCGDKEEKKLLVHATRILRFKSLLNCLCVCFFVILNCHAEKDTEKRIS